MKKLFRTTFLVFAFLTLGAIATSMKAYEDAPSPSFIKYPKETKYYEEEVVVLRYQISTDPYEYSYTLDGRANDSGVVISPKGKDCTCFIAGMEEGEHEFIFEVRNSTGSTNVLTKITIEVFPE